VNKTAFAMAWMPFSHKLWRSASNVRHTVMTWLFCKPEKKCAQWCHHALKRFIDQCKTYRYCMSNWLRGIYPYCGIRMPLVYPRELGDYMHTYKFAERSGKWRFSRHWRSDFSFADQQNLSERTAGKHNLPNAGSHLLYRNARPVPGKNLCWSDLPMWMNSGWRVIPTGFIR